MWPRVRLLGAALLFSTGGAAIKACSLSNWQIAGFRCGIAAVALMLLVPESRRGWNRGTWLVGLAYAATLILFVLAHRSTTAANANFLQSSAPLYVLAISHFALGDRARKADVLSMILILIGLGFIFVGGDAPSASAPRPLVGNVLAAGAAVTWAITILGLGRLAGSGRQAAGAVVAGNLIAFAVSAPAAFPVVELGPVDFVLLLYLGVFQIAIAYILLTSAVGMVSAVETSLILVLDPVLSPLWAWLVHSESPRLLGLVGGAMILSAVVGRSCYQHRSRLSSLSEEERDEF